MNLFSKCLFLIWTYLLDKFNQNTMEILEFSTENSIMAMAALLQTEVNFVIWTKKKQKLKQFVANCSSFRYHKYKLYKLHILQQ